MTESQKNIVVFTAAFMVIAGAFTLIYRHDAALERSMIHWGRMEDSLTVRPSAEEQRIALQFSDVTLPGLKKLGLITRFERTSAETVITVSGRIWNDRSPFFKESFLTQVFIYNKVNGFAPDTRVVEEGSSKLLAQILPPNRQLIL